MISTIFKACVDFLYWLADITGTTYEFVNVIIFCLLWPLLTVFMGIYIFLLNRKIKYLSGLLQCIEHKKD